MGGGGGHERERLNITALEQYQIAGLVGIAVTTWIRIRELRDSILVCAAGLLSKHLTLSFVSVTTANVATIHLPFTYRFFQFIVNHSFYHEFHIV
jgi:hypothetical protein